MVLPRCADDAADRALIATVREALRTAAVPDDAAPMQAYMKSALPFYGLKKPLRAATLKPLYKAWEPGEAAVWRSTVLAMFRGAAAREEWYAALDLLGHRRFKRWLDPLCLELCETLMVEGAWWDIVDEVASRRLRPMLEGWPAQIRPKLWDWARDPDPWLRRSTIICQLRRRDDTDLALLTHAIDANLDDPGFFLRKAIGWALRDLGDFQPEWVQGFVAQRVDRMSALSKREALRKIRARGADGSAR